MQLPLAPRRAARVRRLDTQRSKALEPVRDGPAEPASPLPAPASRSPGGDKAR